MKKLILIFLTIAFFSSAAHAGDFRKATWGMNIEEVRKTEKIKPSYTSDTALAYELSLLNRPFSAMYLFSHEKLVRAKYYCTQTFSNKNKFVGIFNDLVKALTKKYGKPTEANKYFDNDYYRNDPSTWGLGISAGKIAFYTKWDLKKTFVIAFLDGENFKIDCGVEYSSKKLKNLEKTEKEKETQDQL